MILTDEKILDIVTKNKLIDEKTLQEIRNNAKKYNLSLYEALIEKDPVYDEKIGALFAKEINFPFISLAKTSISEDIFYCLPEKFARKQKAIVFERTKDVLKVALSDPTNILTLEMIQIKTGQKPTPYYATELDINAALQLYKKDLQKTVNQLLAEESGSSFAFFEDAPVVKIVDTLIHAAYLDDASDVHIEPEEKDSLIRFRIDGMLHDILQIPKGLHDRIVTRIKVLSSLRTDEHLSAQDGKMRMVIGEENLDIRVSIIPIVEGEKIVLRLLSSRSRQFTLTDLGMTDTDLQKVTNAMNKSFGMILSTGPTGSGKTTSIYAILKILNKREKNITTIEDPVEYRIKGANQVQVNVKTNLTFANGLRSLLRQDPNIIFVGEIRDSETAGIAVNASLTGHLVLSTLHTNDAATALPRLIDMNVEPFLVASTVNVIIAQRLVREICEICKATRTITKEELLKNLPEETISKYIGEKNSIIIYQGAGCKVCHSTGYSGRIGVFEVLEVTKSIKDLITKRQDADVILQKAIEEGMTTMLDDGLEKVMKGLTTIEEVLRVTKIQNK